MGGDIGRGWDGMGDGRVCMNPAGRSMGAQGQSAGKPQGRGTQWRVIYRLIQKRVSPDYHKLCSFPVTGRKRDCEDHCTVVIAIAFLPKHSFANIHFGANFTQEPFFLKLDGSCKPLASQAQSSTLGGGRSDGGEVLCSADADPWLGQASRGRRPRQMHLNSNGLRPVASSL